MSASFPPEQIRAALSRGPMTYRMIADALGYTVIDAPVGWWRRFWWNRSADCPGRQMDRSLRGMLSDLVAVGQIVYAEGPPETWALPATKQDGGAP